MVRLPRSYGWPVTFALWLIASLAGARLGRRFI